MSQYLNIYAKKNNEFICLGSFSRNTNLYQCFKGASYEELIELNCDALEYTREDLTERLHYLNHLLEKVDMNISFLKDVKGNYTLSDLLKQVREFQLQKENLETEKKEIEREECFIYFLKNMIDDYENEGVKLLYGVEASPFSEDE